MAVTSVIVWVFMIAFGVYRVRRYRAGTLEREALAYMRIAHAHRTGDLGVLEAAVARGGGQTSTTAARHPTINPRSSGANAVAAPQPSHRP